MNRPVRIRMQGGVGRAGEKPALTRLGFSSDKRHLIRLISSCIFSVKTETSLDNIL